MRGIAWLYNQSGDRKKAVARYAEQDGCSEETAEQYLAVARFNRSQTPFYTTMQDEDAEETGEDVTRDNSWDYTTILWNGIQAKAVQTAFGKLSYREQRLLEERNAVCMTCGRVSPLSQRKTFEELAVMFEGSSASGAERAYRRAVEKLTVLCGGRYASRDPAQTKIQNQPQKENRRRSLRVSGRLRRRVGRDSI